jgi:hypothetical protein
VGWEVVAAVLEEVFAFLRINIYLICSLTKTGGKKIEWAY